MNAAAATGAGWRRVVLIVALSFATAWVALIVLHAFSDEPLVWPVAGLLTGLAVVVVHQRLTQSRVAQDLREREATHRALVAALEHERSAVDRLRELERVKGDFVATVSHELRTPITSMVGYLELLEDGTAGELTDAQRTLIDRVQRNGRRLHLLVEDLLMLSEIEARRMTITPVPTDLCQVVSRAYDAALPLLDGRALDVVLQLPDEAVAHHGDPDQLERALLNVVSNAVKFTRDGGAVEVVVGVGRRSLLDQAVDQVAPLDAREPGDVEDRLLRVHRGDLATELGQRVDHRDAEAAETRVVGGEQAGRTGADDEQVGLGTRRL